MDILSQRNTNARKKVTILYVTRPKCLPSSDMSIVVTKSKIMNCHTMAMLALDKKRCAEKKKIQTYNVFIGQHSWNVTILDCIDLLVPLYTISVN